MATQMRQVKLASNHHEMRINPAKPIQHYKLQLTDSTPETVQEALKFFKPKLFELLGQYMNVNQNLYTPKLISEEKVQLGPLPGDGETSNCVELVHQGKIESKSDVALIVSRLFKQVIRNQHGMVSVGTKGQKLFWASRPNKFPDQNLEIWPGVEVILKPGDNPTIVIDSAFKMLRYRNALEELNQTKNLECLADQIVMTQYNKKFYKVEGIDGSMRPASTFTNEKGESMSFAQYYEQRYKVKVDPNQPLIKATVRGLKDKQEKTIYLIPSLCQLTGLTDAIRNDFNAMKNLATITKPNGDERIKSASAFAQQLVNTEVTNRKTGEKRNLFKEWGIDINPTNMPIDGKQIHPGNMIMAGGQLRLDLSSRDTNLDRQTQTQMFETPGRQMTCVIIYNKRTGESTMGQLMQNFKAATQDFKFNVFTQPMVKSIEQDREDELEKLTDDILAEAQRNNARVGFVIYLLPGQKKKARLYKTAKRISMQKFGCSSQCIIEKTLSKNTRSIVNKILVQLCAKVGGAPWVIDGLPQAFQSQPTMICGTDCFSKSKRLSQLAFCSTYDRHCCKYYSQVITSGEFGTALQPALKASLLAFKEVNSIFPKNIIIYRDGVGEGQEATVLTTELPQYRAALEELEITESSKIVLVICNKRVSAKFYTPPRNDNPTPGTCIDSKVVCDSANPSFYMIAQVCRQGTVTPSLYKILHSDLPGVEDDIKVLTFKLCWLFYNFTGSIKIPAPVRYAHCLCNFIGENYAQNDKVQFLPVPELVKQKVLFYI